VQEQLQHEVGSRGLETLIISTATRRDSDAITPNMPMCV
jgi:hypothetical protein